MMVRVAALVALAGLASSATVPPVVIDVRTPWNAAPIEAEARWVQGPKEAEQPPLPGLAAKGIIPAPAQARISTGPHLPAPQYSTLHLAMALGLWG